MFNIKERKLWKSKTKNNYGKPKNNLSKKYTRSKVIKFKRIYDEALDLIITGSEVEDKQGLEKAQKEFYNEAEEMMKELPDDYKEFRECLSEFGY